MAFSTTCPPDPGSRTQISRFTGIVSPAWAPGSRMALSALKGLALNTNQGAWSIGPVVGAVRPQLELGYQKNLAGTDFRGRAVLAKKRRAAVRESTAGL